MILIKLFFSFFSVISPKFAAKRAFRLFQKVRKKDIRDREKSFYDSAERILEIGNEGIIAYQSGNPTGPLTILIHGWDSNPGSLSFIERKLESLGYRIVSFTLPAHGYHQAAFTNMFEAKLALQALINHLDPQDPFDAVTHSFGSGVLAYAMSEMNYKLKRAVMLTSPNAILDIFIDYKRMINLGDKAFKYMCQKTNEILGEDIRDLRISSKLQSIDYEGIKIIHDKHDQIIPYDSATQINEENEKVVLESFENIGHYRMLWNEQVLESIIDYLIVKQ